MLQSIADFMALVGHEQFDFGGDLARKPCFTEKRISKSLCHGVDIIGQWENLHGLCLRHGSLQAVLHGLVCSPSGLAP